METNTQTTPMLDAWRLFMQTGRIDSSVVRPEIGASWKRCRELGLDPHAPKQPPRLNARQLQQVMAQNQTLKEVVLPFLKNLANAMRGCDFILSLTDSNAVVLEVFGDEQPVELACRNNNYVPGCVRSESTIGTNAICLSLIERKPIELKGAEHYSAISHSWMCSSAPIFGPDDELLGTVTLTMLLANATALTKGMVISVAEAIHDRLCERHARQQNTHAQTVLSSVLNTISEAMITADESGIVTNVNSVAAQLLGIRADNAIGRSLLKLFPGSPELAAVLVERNNSRIIDISTDKDGCHCNLLVKPYFMRSQVGAEGALLVLRPRKEALNDLRDMTGLSAVFRFEDIIGHSSALCQQVELARMVAKQDTRVLITGETGTGKELFAQSIHTASPRCDGPFVALNCAAIPRELLESELFGYKGGAFTGSRKGGQIGKFELADGGTLFLDEINTLPLDMQSKLLRTLQEGTVMRLGDTKPVRVDVRVLAASNEDLYEKSRDQTFRMDLYFRLSVVEINLPPLRDRGSDICLLAEHILQNIGTKFGKPGLRLSSEAENMLKRYPWVGNVRELENVLEMAAIVCDGTILDSAHLAYRMRGLRPPHSTSALPVPVTPTLVQPMQDMELDLIRNAMREHKGNVALVSRKLGISRSTIYRRLREHSLSREDMRA